MCSACMVRNVSKRERAKVESLPANVELCKTELLMRNGLGATRNVLFDCQAGASNIVRDSSSRQLQRDNRSALES